MTSPDDRRTVLENDFGGHCGVEPTPATPDPRVRQFNP